MHFVFVFREFVPVANPKPPSVNSLEELCVCVCLRFNEPHYSNNWAPATECVSVCARARVILCSCYPART